MKRPTCLALALGLLTVSFAAAAPGPELRDAIAACELYRYREALELLDTLERNAATPETSRYRGIALGKLGRWAEATASLERAAAAAPGDVSLLVDLANAHGQLALASGPLGKFNGARKTRATLERAVALGPDDLEVRSALFIFYLAVPGLVGGSRNKALEHLAVIERLNPLSGRLARVELAAADKEYPLAFALLRALQQDHAADFRAFYVFGRLAATTGLEGDHGLASLKRCLTLPSPLRLPGLPGVHLRMGDILRARGDIAGARAAYQESLRVFPEYPSARDALAKLNNP